MCKRFFGFCSLAEMDLRWRALAFATLIACAVTRLAAAESFDSKENALRYAREYRDPLWSGTYLRARWYAAGLPSFVSRDPASQQVGHYAYTSGNPLMRVDPTGWSERALQRDLSDLNRGIGGHFARLFLSPFIGPLQIAADPRAFWRAMKRDSAGMDLFLFGTIAAELATSATLNPGVGRALRQVPFWSRIGGEGIIGSAQSALASFSDGGRRFHLDRFVQGLEYTMGAELVARIGLGLGYEPFQRNARDIADWIRNQSPYLGNGEAALLRFRRPLNGFVNWDTPWLEAANWGLYHEGIIAVTNDAVHFSEALPTRFVDNTFATRSAAATIGSSSLRFQYVGKVDRFEPDAFFSDPRHLDLPDGDEMQNYRTFRNNCHHHVAAVRRLLGAR